MNIGELAKILKDRYENAPRGYQVAAIHQFGKEYADIIKDEKYKASDIIRLSGLNDSYNTELSKGIKLREYECQYSKTPQDLMFETDKIKAWFIRSNNGEYLQDFLNKNIVAIGWLEESYTNKTRDTLKAKLKEIYPKKEEKAIGQWAGCCYRFANEIQIGDYVLTNANDNQIYIGKVTGEYKYLPDVYVENPHMRSVKWIKAIERKNLSSQIQSHLRPNQTVTCFEDKISIDFLSKLLNEAPIRNNSHYNKVIFPLNQILYGPPGTGKTYSVRKYIDGLLGNNPGLNIEDEEQRINNVVKDLSWYTAIAISMYRNGKNNKYKVANLQHQKIIKAFALTRENKNLRAALWAQMQIHTSTDSKTVNYTNRQEPYIFEKTENSEWYLTEDGIKFVEENLAEQLELLAAKHNVRKIDDFYKFITFHQSYSYEEFVEGIKPSINDESETSTVNYEYNKGIFKEICQQANSDPNNKYLLIIDEINRGNISKIFGELITLIEQDKRVIPNGERIFENTETKEEQLTVTLPYTKSKFGVPNNLYILGTMNTSDRSIASIDIALRRRFKFVEMMPRPELVADFGCSFQSIFEKLNTKIKILLDRDHQIGHSYFINTKYANADISILKEIWFSEIIPLLNEYFYCDWEKLKLIIPGFIKEIDDIPEYLKNECDDTAYEFKTLEDFTSDRDFETALNQEKY